MLKINNHALPTSKTMMTKLIPIFLLASLACFTGCETVKDTFYEPVPFDEVAHQLDISMEEAEALGVVRPKAELAPLVDTISTLIPASGVAPITSLALNGLLAIGAVWLGKKKRTAEQVSTSLVQGIDTFRDILDQTPQGAKIDAKLKETLRHHQQALQVQKEISKLLDRYQTPTKTPIQFKDAA